MIDQLEGEILEIEPTHAVVQVGGVGFHLSISVYTYEAVGRSKHFYFYTHLYVREDQLRLFGFAERSEREAFRKLIGISGVGPKVAQAILSSLTPSTLADAVTVGDWKRLTAAPGIGRKLAERMTVELRGSFKPAEEPVIEGEEAAGRYAGPAGGVYETMQALVALGYSAPQAERLAVKASKSAGDGAGVEELIRIALKT